MAGAMVHVCENNVFDKCPNEWNPALSLTDEIDTDLEPKSGDSAGALWVYHYHGGLHRII